MHNAQDLSNCIKARAREMSISLTDLTADCGLGINALNQLTDKKGLSCFALARIADYLDCSVDYLLGRTDNPDVNK